MKHNKETFEYSLGAKLFHWILAILIIFMLCLGWYMVAIADAPSSHSYFQLHKSIGLIVGVLVVLRLIWRFTHEPAPHPDSVPLWQQRASTTVHWLLYLCIFLMPLVGFLGASFGERGIAFFGYPIPRWLPQNKAMSDQLFYIHGIIAYILVALIIIHILAALKHLLINKDNVFKRMWF
jgi:cytochrome b561